MELLYYLPANRQLQIGYWRWIGHDIKILNLLPGRIATFYCEADSRGLSCWNALPGHLAGDTIAVRKDFTDL